MYDDGKDDYGGWKNSATGESIPDAYQQNKPPMSNRGPMFEWKLEGENKWRHETTGEVVTSKTNPGSKPLTWDRLSLHDWSTICSCLLLMSHDRYFVESFGPQKHKLVLLKQQMNSWLSMARIGLASEESKQKQRLLECLRGKYDLHERRVVPDDATMYGLAVQIDMPRSPSDPSHWGHAVWLYCEFIHCRQRPSHTREEGSSL